MNFSLSEILALARFTVQYPRSAARSLMAMRLPDSARWLLFGLVATGSAVLTHIGFNMLTAAEKAFMGNAMASPIQTAILQAGFLLLTVVTVYGIGRWRGGRGSFGDALLLIGWLQIVLLCLQAAQIVALLILPPVAEIIGILGLVLSFWLLTQFVTELHGFASAWRVFLAIMVAIFGVAVVIVMLLMAIMGPGG